MQKFILNRSLSSFSKKNYLLYALMWILHACNVGDDSITINVKDFGVKANSNESITAQINKIIENLDGEKVNIVFPNGRYDFYPDSNYLRSYYETNTHDLNPKRLAILIDWKKNITIDGKGSDFIFHDNIQPFTVDNSENITIKNVNIDWDIPLAAESRVIEASNSHLLLEIDSEQFPFTLGKNRGIDFYGEGWLNNWQLLNELSLVEIDKDHIIPVYRGDNRWVNNEHENDLVYSIINKDILQIKGEFTKLPDVSNHLVMQHGKSDHAGIFFFHCKDVELENINVYHAPGHAILSQFSKNVALNKVNIIPNLSKKRFLSGCRSGLHFMGCKGEVVINDCDAKGLLNDPIQIHGTNLTVIERLNNKTVKCKFTSPLSSGLLWASKGDTVSFLEMNTKVPLGINTVNKFEFQNKDTVVITFYSDILKEVDSNYLIENLSRTPNVTITNCVIGCSRGRGCSISTPGSVTIKNNVFETRGSSRSITENISIQNEYSYNKNVMIEENEFKASYNLSYKPNCNTIINISKTY